MEQFNLDTWLQDKSRKVVTRDGREVDIYYSPTSRIPLIGRTSDNYIYQYTKDGFQCDIMNQAKNDLFFADEEEKFTEFEKELEAMLQDVERCDFTDESFDFWKDRLLDLARQEIRKEEREKLGTIEMPIDILNPYYQIGYENALRTLPKWKKATEHLRGEGFIHYDNHSHRMTAEYAYTNVEGGEYYLSIDDLKTLPKEE